MGRGKVTADLAYIFPNLRHVVSEIADIRFEHGDARFIFAAGPPIQGEQLTKFTFDYTRSRF
jgi:hypothetical protein